MSNVLLERQARLVEHLTSGAGIFGAARGIANEPALAGLDLGLLHLEARFSHHKRMQKITWVLGETINLLGDRRAAIVRDFADACPPMGISWLENARQFHDFLIEGWRREDPDPPHLPDVAAYELAYGIVRAGETPAPKISDDEPAALPGAIRRHPGAILLRCAYDIRPIVEGRASKAAPERCDTLIALTLLPGTEIPWVSQPSHDLFELLEMLDDFIDPESFEDTPEVARLVSTLAAEGLIEVHR